MPDETCRLGFLALRVIGLEHVFFFYHTRNTCRDAFYNLGVNLKLIKRQNGSALRTSLADRVALIIVRRAAASIDHVSLRFGAALLLGLL